VLEHQPGNAKVPVAFDPCRPVHYVVNPAGEPADGQQLVADAVARLQETTGLRFVADGATTESPSKERLAYQPRRQVVLDRVQLDPALLPDRTVARAVILHELGHLVGLDHTSDRSQLVYSEAEFNVRDYGAGDLRGLALLGTQACVPEL
jgi:predicted Zn-dependent protease